MCDLIDDAQSRGWLLTGPPGVSRTMVVEDKWIGLCQKSSRPIVCAHADDGLSYTVTVRHTGDYGPDDAMHLAELFTWATTNPRHNAGSNTNPQCLDYMAAQEFRPAEFTIWIDEVPIERMPELYRRAMILLGAAA